MAKPTRPLMPPDGGWGWMVVLGVSVCYATTQSLLSVFGLLFADTLEEMGEGTTGAAIISNSMVATTNFSGLVMGPVMKFFTYRQVAMAGGLLVAIGMMVTSLATRMWHLLISYSILVGLGLGLLNPSTFVVVNAYFTTSRGRAVGLSMAGTGIGQMLMPHAVRFLLEEYSFRGTVLILGAVALHSLAGAALFHPLHWHALPAPDPEQGGAASPAAVEMTPLRADDPKKAVPLAVAAAGAAKPKPKSKHASYGGGADLEAASVPPQPAPERRPATALRDVAAVGENLPALTSVTVGAGVGVGVGTGAGAGAGDDQKAAHAALAGDKAVEKKSGCWQRYVRLLDLDLLRDPAMLSLLAGLAAVYTAGVNFNMLFPFFLADAGLARSQVALCMSLQAGFDISSRLVLPAFTDRARVPARITFLVGSIALACCRSLLALQGSLEGLLVTSSLCGFIRGTTTVNLNLAISESCSPEKLPGALGINMVLKGISILLIGLFVGWLRDSTNSFALCLHVLSLMVVIPMLAWLVEILVRRRRGEKEKESR